jgi:hypothetical protein
MLCASTGSVTQQSSWRLQRIEERQSSEFQEQVYSVDRYQRRQYWQWLALGPVTRRLLDGKSLLDVAMLHCPQSLEALALA